MSPWAVTTTLGSPKGPPQWSQVDISCFPPSRGHTHNFPGIKEGTGKKKQTGETDSKVVLADSSLPV